MKICFISDLHTLHYKWELKMLDTGGWTELEHADIIVFCGDMSSRGYEREVRDFLEWFDKVLPSVPKIFIAGNHDFFWEVASKEMIEELLAEYPNLTYLNDSGCEIMGIKFWGSPVSPWFHDWAFNRFRSQGEDGIYKGIKAHWDIIPDDTDVLIVHGPPRGILDRVNRPKPGENPHVGCDDLLDAIERVEPSIVAFGHIHEGYGKEVIQHVTYVNASSLNDRYEPMNPPITVNIKNKIYE
jgi:Icc-related predicted phosphoesterase